MPWNRCTWKQAVQVPRVQRGQSTDAETSWEQARKRQVVFLTPHSLQRTLHLLQWAQRRPPGSEIGNSLVLSVMRKFRHFEGTARDPTDLCGWEARSRGPAERAGAGIGAVASW